MKTENEKRNRPQLHLWKLRSTYFSLIGHPSSLCMLNRPSFFHSFHWPPWLNCRHCKQAEPYLASHRELCQPWWCRSLSKRGCTQSLPLVEEHTAPNNQPAAAYNSLATCGFQLCHFSSVLLQPERLWNVDMAHAQIMKGHDGEGLKNVGIFQKLILFSFSLEKNDYGAWSSSAPGFSVC